MIRDILIASLNKGQFPLAIVGLLVAIVLARMPPEDISKLVFLIIENLKNGAFVGYVLFVATTGGWFVHARFQRRVITGEMRRISDERTRVQEKALGKPLPSSEE
jgi:hypothetical protein